MESLVYIIPLAILPTIIYSLLLFLNLPFKSVNLMVAFTYIFLGTISAGMLLTFSELLPGWHDIACNIANPIYNRTLYLHVKYYLEVGFLEELCKMLTFLLITLYRFLNNKTNNDTMIGTIIYCGMVSLGFSIVENILYAVDSTSPISVLIWRPFTAMVTHLLCGLYIGYFIVRGRIINLNSKTIFGNVINRFPRVKVVAFGLFGLFIGTLIHGLYDLHLVANSPNGLSGAYILFTTLIVGLIMCLWDIKSRLKDKHNTQTL